MITVEEVKTYVKVKDELYKSCEKWAKTHLYDWQHYSGFSVDDQSISIEYNYQDYLGNPEFDSIRIPIKEILQ